MTICCSLAALQTRPMALKNIQSDASDFGWGGQTMEDAPQYAREYFSEEESSQTSTYRKLLGVFR